MKGTGKSAGFIVLTVILLAAFFLYFFKFNGYHLWHLEQNQLFRYNKDYIFDFLKRPGGFILLAGAFCTRFFYNAWLAASIVTCLAGIFFYMTSRTLKHYHLNYFIPAAFTVVILAGLHSSHNYIPAYTAGWLILIAVFYLYIQIGKPALRYPTGLIIFPVLFYLCGFFALPFVLLVIMHEVFYAKQRNRYIFSIGMITTGILVPLVFQQYIFLTGNESAWIIPINPLLFREKTIIIFFLPAYLLILFAALPLIIRMPVNKPVKTLSAILFICCGFFLIRANYDKKNEVFLHMENCYQQSDYRQVLSLSRKYPGNNQLVIYYTNLALCRTGQLSEKMFLYNQAGSQGLWLQWSRNETAPMYGSEFYEIVGYTNEASRWAFEAMEINDLNPRSLKKLITASLINDQEKLAAKYRYLLTQNSHYASLNEMLMRL